MKSEEKTEKKHGKLEEKKEGMAKKMYKGLTEKEMKGHSGSIKQFKNDLKSGEAKGKIGKKTFGYYNQKYNE